MWMVALDAFLSMNPFILWDTYSGSAFFDVAKKIIELIIMAFFLFQNNIKIKDKTGKVMIGFLCIYFFYYLNVYPGTLDLSIGIFTKFFLIMIFLALPESNKISVFEKFTTILSISLVSALLFWSVSLLGIHMPSDFISADQAIKVYNNQHYLHYFGCVFRESIYYSPRIKQLCGMFDEPGMVGTVCALTLVGNRFRIKNNKKVIILLIAGILSFSLAFYIITFLYFSYYYLSKRKLKKSQLLVLGGLVLLLVFLANNTYFQERIISRLSLASLINNNRTSAEFDIIFSDFLQSDAILLGVGNNSPVFMTVDASSYKVLIYAHGFIGFALIVGWFIYGGIIYAKKNRDALILLGFFVLSIYQRPWVISLYYILNLFGGIAYLCQGDSSWRSERSHP